MKLVSSMNVEFSVHIYMVSHHCQPLPFVDEDMSSSVSNLGLDNCTSLVVSGVSEGLEFSPFARETFPLALEHAWG